MCFDSPTRFFLLQFWSAYVPCSSQHLDSVQLALEQIDLIRRLVNKHPENMVLVTTAEGTHFGPRSDGYRRVNRANAQRDNISQTLKAKTLKAHGGDGSRENENSCRCVWRTANLGKSTSRNFGTILQILSIRATASTSLARRSLRGQSTARRNFQRPSI